MLLNTAWKNRSPVTARTLLSAGTPAWKTKIWLPMMILSLAGCGLTQTIADGAVSATSSLFYKQVKVLHLDFIGREELNTDANEENSSSEPVLVRIYQLRDNKNFMKTVYQHLAAEGDEELKEALLASRSLVVKPGAASSLNMPVEKEAKFIGIVGLFRQPELEKNSWRLLLPLNDLDPDKPRTIEVGNNSLNLLTGIK